MYKKLLLSIASAVILSGSINAQTIVGITTDNRVFQITSATAPGVTTTPISVTGITAGQNIVGADFRPNTGQLYLMGYDPSTTASQLYTLNYATGVATPVTTTTVMLALGTGSISFDFNPTVDRIRVTGSNRKNYRLHPLTGAIAATDVDLAYAVGDVNAAATPDIGAVAYTNSYIGTETTTLFDYDQTLNVIALQNPPNNGTLNTIGASGVTVNTTNRRVDMDIWFDPMTMTNKGYLVANTGGVTDNLYTVNTTTGALTLVGPVAMAGVDVKDIAVVIDRTVPANVNGQLIYGLTKTNKNLITFDSDAPGIIRSLVAPSGVTAGQVLVGMDVRPFDRNLYALGYNATNGEYQVYSMNTTTGAATAINTAPGTLALGTGTNIGFDFNPTVDRIRVISSNGMNYRLNPLTGAIAATDTSLTFAVGDANNGRPTRVGSVAYINSFKGATATTLFGIDDSAGAFVSIIPPNSGFVNTIATIPGFVNAADYTTDIDFYYDSVTSTNIGYVTANPSSVNDALYTVTTAGVPSLKGPIGMGIPIADIAAQLRYTGPGVPTGISNTPRTGGLNAYPNPVQNELYITLPALIKGNATIVITDATGKIVHRATVSGSNQTFVVNTTSFAAGLYFIQVQTADATYAPVTVIKK